LVQFPVYLIWEIHRAKFWLETIGKPETQEASKPGLFANVIGNKPAQDGAKPGLFAGLTAGAGAKPFGKNIDRLNELYIKISILAFGSGSSDQKDSTPSEGAKPGLLGLGGLGTLSAAKPFSGGSGSFSSLFGGANSKPSALFSKPAAGGGNFLWN